MIRITCPQCSSKLNAKDELAGHTRRCPKCGAPIKIEPAAPAESLIHPAAEDRLPIPDLPERINRQSHYLICDKTHVVATWENNGRGWMFRVGAGFGSAKRNRELLPSEGDFKLVELRFAITDEGKRLTGMVTYQLVTRWALTVLHESDDSIIEKITDFGCLNKDQKFAVRKALKEQFMAQVWHDSAEILEYLGNTDYHSSSVGS